MFPVGELGSSQLHFIQRDRLLTDFSISHRITLNMLKYKIETPSEASCTKAAFKHAWVWKNIILIPCGIFLGGPLTVTDANLALGRLLPSFFPKIFGPGENEPLSLEETMKHFRHLTQEINLFLSSNQSQALIFTEILSSLQIFLLYLCKGVLIIRLKYLCFHAQVSANGANSSHKSTSEMSVEEVAMGFVRVANEAMCRPIRALTQVLWVLKLWAWLDSNTECLSVKCVKHLKSCMFFLSFLSRLPTSYTPIG